MPDKDRSDPAPGTFQRLDRVAPFPYEPGEYARRYFWRLVEVLLVAPSPRRARRWRRFWLRRFGADCRGSISGRARVWHPWLLSLGRYSAVADRVTIYNLGRVTIGEHTVISQDVYLCAGTHDYTKPEMPLRRETIRVGHGVWICAGAFIGPGVTIGDNAIVGARAVVMQDVEPGVIVAGNPARTVRRRPMEVQTPAPSAG